MKASKVAYKPIGLVPGAASGILAGAAFRQTWKMIGHDALDVTHQDRSGQEILLAAALQGAVFAVFKAASTGPAPPL
ncbi:DUF4235 domain-containing protein [Streptomyces sp. NPDC014623]|uniref:DUF4235 domain-containing protein n=1 Tax=Streptomyces sp. NPDC014623 TaxID=3364875 RepID=UPI0036FC656D